MKNKDNYNRLKHDPSEKQNRLVNDTIERFKKQKMLKEKVAEGLKTETPIKPKFYLQWKIHKKGNPGRPAISSVNCHTFNISKYADYHFLPIAEEIPSYFKDKYFIRKLYIKSCMYQHSKQRRNKSSRWSLW